MVMENRLDNKMKEKISKWLDTFIPGEKIEFVEDVPNKIQYCDEFGEVLDEIIVEE